MTTIHTPAHMILLGGEVQYRSIFTCARCGASQLGDVRRRDVHDLDRARPSPHAMPVGWSSHYAPQGDYFFCSVCKPA